MRALFFSPTLGAGGAEMQVLRLVRHLDRGSVLPLVSVARGGGSYESRLPADVALHVCTRRVRSSLASSAASVLPLGRRIARDRPDVVVSLIEHASLALVCAAARVRPRPRIVLGIQNNFSLRMARAPLHERVLLRRLYLEAYRAADRIVALSHGVADDLAAVLPGSAARTTVVYNAGMEPELEAMARERLAHARPAAPLLVACGRLTEQKDYPTLLRAFAALGMPTARLWILGRGPLEASLRALAASLGVAERVQWLGFRENPYPYMAAADVFVLSSRWEGFGNVLVEALACGTPVVATDCPFGPGEILAGGRHGSLVPVGDVRGLAAALGAALERGKSAELSEQCRARARSFDAAHSAAGYAAVLEAAVREGRAA